MHNVFVIFNAREYIWLFMLALCLIIVTTPRFDRREFREEVLQSEGRISIEKLGDSTKYIALTQYFRNELEDVSMLKAPFTYRIMVPFIASFLPFQAITSINIVNVFFMMIGLIFLYKLLALFVQNFYLRIVGCGLYVFSFPTFYYGTIGYVDPVLICFLIMGTYMIFTNNWLLLAFVVIFGLLVKETIVILLPVWCMYFFLQGRLLKKEGLLIPLIAVVYIAENLIVRAFIPGQPGYLWLPSINSFMFNISRFHGWISFLLSFGVPGLLSLLMLCYCTHNYFLERAVIIKTLFSGLVISFILVIYSVLTAYADGRFIWTSYPFTIPLAVMVLDYLWRKKMMR